MPVLPEALATPIFAFCVAALSMPFLNRLAAVTGFVDQPNSRKIHIHPIPLLGGLGVYAAVILTLMLRGEPDARVWLMMLASFLLMLLGVLDDRFDLHSRYRLLLHVLAALGLSVSGVRFHFFPVEALDHLVTVLWIVGVINAINCLDCADGVAGSTCLVAFLSLAGMALAHQRFFVCQVSLAAAGAVIGFLVYNFPPARVFMGNAGSTFLGLMVAVLAILANPVPSKDWQLPLAPFVLVVPVFDIVWVHCRRYQAGIRSMRDLLSSTGKDHLPHRLMARGLSKPVCMGVMFALAALAGAGVYALLIGGWVMAGMAFIVLLAFLWHLEENAHVVIRPEDHCALYQLRSEPAGLPQSLRSEENVA